MGIFSKKPKLHDGYILSLPLKDRLIYFYRDPVYNRVSSMTGEEVLKVDEDKVIGFEFGLCETCRENFMELGLLRLHTPLDIHQERLSRNFLYVPPSERVRIAQMLGGKPLITRYSLSPVYNEYCTVEEKKDETQSTLHRELGEAGEASFFGYRIRPGETPDRLATPGLVPLLHVVRCFKLSELVGSLEHMKRFVFEFEGEDDAPNNLDSNSKRSLRQAYFGIPYEEAYDQSHVDKKDRFFFSYLGLEGMFVQRGRVG
jgi:hypothetical protein